MYFKSPSDDIKQQFLTVEEQQIVASAALRADPNLSDTELLMIMKWAEDASFNHHMLTFVLHGSAAPHMSLGDIGFSITEKGKQFVDSTQTVAQNGDVLYTLIKAPPPSS